MEPGWAKTDTNAFGAPYAAYQDPQQQHGQYYPPQPQQQQQYPPFSGYAGPVEYVADGQAPLVNHRGPAVVQPVVMVEEYSSLWYELNSQYYNGPCYSNPNDPHLCVPKRWGFGWTINYGKPEAKYITAFLVVLVIAVIVLCATLPLLYS